MSSRDRSGDGGARVHTVHTDGRVHLVVEGDLDIASAHRFEDALADAVRNRRGVVVDLRRATFVGACALPPIVGASQQLQRFGAGVTVVVGHDVQRRLFTLTQVDTVVRLCQESDDGEASPAAEDVRTSS